MNPVTDAAGAPDGVTSSGTITGEATASARASIAPWRTVMTGAENVGAEVALYAPP